MLRVSQVGGGGRSATWDGSPNMGVFFKYETPLNPPVFIIIITRTLGTTNNFHLG